MRIVMIIDGVRRILTRLFHYQLSFIWASFWILLTSPSFILQGGGGWTRNLQSVFLHRLFATHLTPSFLFQAVFGLLSFPSHLVQALSWLLSSFESV